MKLRNRVSILLLLVCLFGLFSVPLLWDHENEKLIEEDPFITDLPNFSVRLLWDHENEKLIEEDPFITDLPKGKYVFSYMDNFYIQILR